MLAMIAGATTTAGSLIAAGAALVAAKAARAAQTVGEVGMTKLVKISAQTDGNLSRLTASLEAAQAENKALRAARKP